MANRLSEGPEVYLDPTAEADVVNRTLTPRPQALHGTIGLLDISKPRGDIFLDVIEDELVRRGLRVERYRKPTFTKPAPADLRRQIGEQCDLVIEALAD